MTIKLRVFLTNVLWFHDEFANLFAKNVLNDPVFNETVLFFKLIIKKTKGLAGYL